MKKSVSRLTVALFWHHVTRYKRLLVPLLILIPATVLVMDFAQPYILSLVFARISNGHYNHGDVWSTFLPYISAYAAAAALSGIAGWRINIWLIWNLELRVVRDLSQRIFDHLQRMSAGFHNDRFAGSLVSQANKLTGAYVRLIDSFVFNVMTLITAMLATIIILAPRVPLFALALTIFSAIYIAGTILFSRPVRLANVAESEIQSKQTGYLADSIANQMVVKSFAASSHESQRYAEMNAQVQQAGRRSMRVTTVREAYASVITTSMGVVALIIAVAGITSFHNNIATLFLIVNYTSAVGMRMGLPERVAPVQPRLRRR